MEREKSQTQIQVHRRSASMRENSTSKMALRNETSKIPAKMPTKRAANSEVRTQNQICSRQQETAQSNAQQSNQKPAQPAIKKEEAPKTKVTEKPPPKQCQEISPTKAKLKPKKEEPDPKASPQRRQINRPKHPPPVSQNRPQPPSVPKSVELERELTQTIMTVKQLKDRGINPVEMGMPEIPPLKPPEDQKANLCASPAATLNLSTETLTQGCSPTPTIIATNQESAKTKPRSVVKPMPKPAMAVTKTTAPARKVS
jgi:hypothetical protein